MIIASHHIYIQLDENPDHGLSLPITEAQSLYEELGKLFGPGGEFSDAEHPHCPAINLPQGTIGDEDGGSDTQSIGVGPQAGTDVLPFGFSGK